MTLALRPDMVLEKNEAQGYVTLRKRDQDESRHHPKFHLHPFQGLVLALFDGQRSREQVVEIATAVIQSIDATENSSARIEEAVAAIISRYRHFLTEQDGRTPLKGQDCSPAEFLFPTTYNFRQLRFEAPAALLWVVTEYCNRKCRYCYMDARFTPDGRAADLGLGLDRLRELACEAAEIGVTRLVLSGGEPFLRPDLVEIIGLFTSKNVDVIPITKSRVSGERMQALRATGLDELHVSLDSHRAEMVAELTGIPTAFSDMVATLESAREYGQKIVLRPVLTSRNLCDFEGLVDFAYGLGVRRFLVDIYKNSCGGRYDANLKIEAQDIEGLCERQKVVTERYPDAVISLEFDHDETSTALREGREGKGCVSGLRSLTVLPDGRVTKCEHWHGDDLVFGDLRVQSMMEVWESDRAQEINHAPRQLFEGTICFRCKRLDVCNEFRGRCSLSALDRFGTVHAPDVHCPIGAYEKSDTRPAAHRRAKLPVIAHSPIGGPEGGTDSWIRSSCRSA